MSKSIKVRKKVLARILKVNDRAELLYYADAEEIRALLFRVNRVKS